MGSGQGLVCFNITDRPSFYQAHGRSQVGVNKTRAFSDTLTVVLETLYDKCSNLGLGTYVFFLSSRRLSYSLYTTRSAGYRKPDYGAVHDSAVSWFSVSLVNHNIEPDTKIISKIIILQPRPPRQQARRGGGPAPALRGDAPRGAGAGGGEKGGRGPLSLPRGLQEERHQEHQEPAPGCGWVIVII